MISDFSSTEFSSGSSAPRRERLETTPKNQFLTSVANALPSRNLFQSNPLGSLYKERLSSGDLGLKRCVSTTFQRASRAEHLSPEMGRQGLLTPLRSQSCLPPCSEARDLNMSSSCASSPYSPSESSSGEPFGPSTLRLLSSSPPHQSPDSTAKGSSSTVQLSPMEGKKNSPIAHDDIDDVDVPMENWEQMSLSSESITPLRESITPLSQKKNWRSRSTTPLHKSYRSTLLDRPSSRLLLDPIDPSKLFTPQSFSDSSKAASGSQNMLSKIASRVTPLFGFSTPLPAPPNLEESQDADFTEPESLRQPQEESSGEFLEPPKKIIPTPPRPDAVNGIKKPTPQRTPHKKTPETLADLEAAVQISPPREVEGVKKPTPSRSLKSTSVLFSEMSVEDMAPPPLSSKERYNGFQSSDETSPFRAGGESFRTTAFTKTPERTPANTKEGPEKKRSLGFPKLNLDKWKRAGSSSVSAISDRLPNTFEQWTDTAKTCADTAEYVLGSIDATASGTGGLGLAESLLDLKGNIEDGEYGKACATFTKTTGDGIGVATNFLALAQIAAPAALIASGPIGTAAGLGVLTLFEGQEARENFLFHQKCINAIESAGIRNFLAEELTLSSQEQNALSREEQMQKIKSNRDTFTKRTSEDLLNEALKLLHQTTGKVSQEQWIELARKIELQSFENEVKSAINTSLGVMNTAAVVLAPLSQGITVLVAGGITLGYAIADGKDGYIVKKVASSCWKHTKMGKTGNDILMHMRIEPHMPGTPRYLGNAQIIELDEEGTPRATKIGEIPAKQIETIFTFAANLKQAEQHKRVLEELRTTQPYRHKTANPTSDA